MSLRTVNGFKTAVTQSVFATLQQPPDYKLFSLWPGFAVLEIQQLSVFSLCALNKILEESCFRRPAQQKGRFTDGADWAGLPAEAKLCEQTVPCCEEVSFSQERGKEIILRSDISGSFAFYWQPILFKLTSSCIWILCDGFMPLLVSFDRANQTALIQSWENYTINFAGQMCNMEDVFILS